MEKYCCHGLAVFPLFLLFPVSPPSCFSSVHLYVSLCVGVTVQSSSSGFCTPVSHPPIKTQQYIIDIYIYIYIYSLIQSSPDHSLTCGSHNSDHFCVLCFCLFWALQVYSLLFFSCLVVSLPPAQCYCS